MCTWTPARTSTPRRPSSSTPRRSDRAYAMPQRRCSSTRTSRTRSCPGPRQRSERRAGGGRPGRRPPRAAGVELRPEPRARAAGGPELADAAEATDEDFAEEFLALVLAVKVVDSVD